MPDEPFLFLYGNDEFAIARRLNDIQARHDRDGMNTARLEARTASEDELNNALNAMPFLSEKRLLFLANPSKQSSDPARRKKLIDFMLKAPPTTLVVLHEHVEPRDMKKHWLIKRAATEGLKAEACNLPRLQEMPTWIIAEARRQKGEIEPLAAKRLAEMTGDETRLAAQEIGKLLAYANFSRPITLKDVEAVSIDSAQGDIFALVDALGSGNGRTAQKLLHRLLEDQDAMEFWGMVIRQFRLLLQAKEILEHGGGMFELQQKMGLIEFVAEKVAKQAGRFSLPALEKVYHHLLEMDAGYKTGQVPLDLALDMLVMELTR